MKIINKLNNKLNQTFRRENKNMSKITKICPKCGKEYTERPAISRMDNSEICPECGTLEALNAVGYSEEEKEEGMKLVHESLKKARISE